MSHFPEDTGQFELEPVERREDLRGYVYGVTSEIEGGERVPVREASQRGLFLELADPEAIALRESQELKVFFEELEVEMTVIVVRKEIEPRTGIAFRIVNMHEGGDKLWEQIVKRAQRGSGTPS